jgi:FixJ family two-component response regulator
MLHPALIVVVDDDPSVRESLPDLLHELGYMAMAFSSAEEFLASDSVPITKCLILDVTMPGMSGPDLKRELERQGQKIPIVFITAHESVATRAVREAAVAWLAKPFSDKALHDALSIALNVS